MNDIQKKEKGFQIALSKYRQFGDRNSYEAMWSFVIDCCSNIAKKKLKGIKINDLHDKIMDSQADVMAKIESGQNPLKMSSFCYYPVINALYNKKVQREDKNLSVEQLYEAMGDAPFCNSEY